MGVNTGVGRVGGEGGEEEEKERGRSQKLNHNHVSNLRVIFLLPKDINQIKLVLLWMKEREYNNIMNQSNYHSLKINYNHCFLTNCPEDARALVNQYNLTKIPQV